jgi:hypothetical protein
MRNDDALKMYAGVLAMAKIAAQDVGEERALSVLKKWIFQHAYEKYGQKKKQLGINGTTIKDAYTCFRSADEDYGVRYEVEEETAERITMTIKDCPLFTAAVGTGWDWEKLSSEIMQPLFEEVTSIINPDIVWKLVKFNPNPKEGSQYELSYK